MRILAGVLAVAVIAACGDGDESERPRGSARPELTADEIFEAATDDVYPAGGSGGGSFRAAVVRRSFNPDGSRDESTSEEWVVGEDHYTKFSDGHEVFVYRGESYSRTDSNGKWLTLEEAGFGLLADYFDDLAVESEIASGSYFDSAFELERLADEFINGRHALRVRGRYQYDEEELGLFIPDDLPTPRSGSPTPPLADSAEVESNFWVDAESLEPLRMGSLFIGYLGGREIQRIMEDWKYSEFNEIEGFPVELPDAE